MNKELVNTENTLIDLENTQKMCQMLMRTKHYQKMGEEGVFAIVQKAVSLGINPLEALNGALYYVQGKVEMTAQMMASLIRQKKHSITMDRQSNKSSCILHGKRADTGDCWKASFSIEDAKVAGIYKQGGPWSKYPDIMCYNRALSKLARQLFPDIIGNCYVEGEISMAPPLYDTKASVESIEEEIAEVAEKAVVEVPAKEYERITEEQCVILDDLIGEDDQYRNQLLAFMKKQLKADTLEALPAEWYERVYNRAKQNFDTRNANNGQYLEEISINQAV